MEAQDEKLFAGIKTFVSEFSPEDVPLKRRPVLQLLSDYINRQKLQGIIPQLHFICTHNSRRSQLAQVWAKVAADYFDIEIHSFSGGTEATAFNERAIETLRRVGFIIKSEGESNPLYQIFYNSIDPPILAFSKVYYAPSCPDKNFVAVMTCSEADEHCPFIPGTDLRIPLTYQDPKTFDDTPQEAEKYLERSRQIAAEMFYVFSRVG